MRQYDLYHQGRSHRVEGELSRRPSDDSQPLHAHGFTDEDIWDIGAIAAFFGLSNRMAHVLAMRPNDEFFLMGRVPRPPRG